MKAIPNILSFARLALCPVFVWAFFYRSPIMAFAIFAVASLLDVVDGFIARRFHAITTLGKILDPVADKILQFSAAVCFTVKGILPLFVVIIIGLKELMMLIGGGVISKKRKNMVYSNQFGKIASFFTSASLGLMFFVDNYLNFAAPVIYGILYASVTVSILSLVQYAYFTIFAPKKTDKGLPKK